MSTVNRVFLVGNLGKDPELRQTQSGTQVCNFTLATTSKGAQGEQTDWHNIQVWDKQAEACQKYLKKGSKACVEGRLKYSEYTDKDGVKKHRTDIVASQVTFLSSVAKEESQEKRWTPPVREVKGTTRTVQSFNQDDLGDIPF